MNDYPPALAPPEPDELRSGPTRRRLVPLGIAVVAVLALTAAAWAVFTVRSRPPSSAAPSPTFSTAVPPTSTPAPSGGPVRLVAATGDTVTVPVTAGWLP